MPASCVVCEDLLPKDGKAYPDLKILNTALKESAGHCLYCSVLWKGLVYFNSVEMDRIVDSSYRVLLAESTYSADMFDHKPGRLKVSIDPTIPGGPFKNVVCFAESRLCTCTLS